MSAEKNQREKKKELEPQKYWETKEYKVTRENWGEKGELKENSRPEWIIGWFREAKSLARRDDFELKYWEFEEDKKGKKKNGNKNNHEPKFQILATEYNFIIEGKIEGWIITNNGKKEEISLNKGDYVVIRPGTIVNLEEKIIEKVKGITIKIPSRHGDTIKKSFIEKLINKTQRSKIKIK